ncbi:hypothetical protein LZ31DRAFT_636503 [Colletotrichum somersetense]|nr:hypothetical protein LZ31DRAFT_636503 [Colletotrichum somersetense]
MYIALIYGLLSIWFGSFPIVFSSIYGFSLGLGVAFLGILKYTEPNFNGNGELKPELRLQPSFAGAFAIPICLFWFGWSSRSDIHWVVPIIGTVWFGIGAFLLFNSVTNYLNDVCSECVAGILAGNDFLRSALGAGFPLFAMAMYERLGVAWASSTLAFISVAFIPIPFILYCYSEKTRHKSKNARHDL